MSPIAKICCGLVAIILIVVVVFVILGFTLFKPKDPEVTARAVNLGNFMFNTTDMSSNVTIDMVITIRNKNYGSFTFVNSSASVKYRGDIVGDIPMLANIVNARSERNINTYAAIMPSKLLTNPKIFVDIVGGNLTFSSDTLLRGKVKVLKIAKMHATVFTHCDMNISLASKTSDSICHSKLKLR